MNLVNKDVKIFKPMCDVLDKCNISNCIYLGDMESNEHHLFIDTEKLSFVNREILYVMCLVYKDTFSFGDTLVDDMTLFTNVGKEDFSKHRYVCFKLPVFEECFDNYTIGFFLEFANCFVKQEPIPELENIYTKEEMDRYKAYFNEGREDFKDICMISILGEENPLKNDPDCVKASVKRFYDGEIVNNNKNSLKHIAKKFCLTTTRALTNYNRYMFDVNKEERAKQKTKGYGI